MWNFASPSDSYRSPAETPYLSSLHRPPEGPIVAATKMSLVNLASVCAHLNNATKARLGLTSIPNTNLHLKLCQALKNDGYLSTVVRGGPTPPPAHPILGFPAANDVEPITRDNVASRRLWLGLKYWRNESVLGKVQLVSKPTRRVRVTVEDLRKIVRGEESNYVAGLRSPGESLYISTDQGILEARQCVEKKIGGQALCRVL